MDSPDYFGYLLFLIVGMAVGIISMLLYMRRVNWSWDTDDEFRENTVDKEDALRTLHGIDLRRQNG